MQIFNFSKPQGVPRFYMRRTIDNLGQREVSGLQKRYRQTSRFSIIHTYKTVNEEIRSICRYILNSDQNELYKTVDIWLKQIWKSEKKIAVMSYKKQQWHGVKNCKNIYVSRGTI